MSTGKFIENQKGAIYIAPRPWYIVLVKYNWTNCTSIITKEQAGKAPAIFVLFLGPHYDVRIMM